MITVSLIYWLIVVLGIIITVVIVVLKAIIDW